MWQCVVPGSLTDARHRIIQPRPLPAAAGNGSTSRVSSIGLAVLGVAWLWLGQPYCGRAWNAQPEPHKCCGLPGVCSSWTWRLWEEGSGLLLSQNPKNGVEGKGGRTQYLARKKEVGFFPSLHLIIFSRCNALQSSSCCSLPVSPLFASGAVASLLSTSSPQLGRSLWGRQQGPQGFCRQRSSLQALPASSWQLCAHGSVQWSHQNTDAAELSGRKILTGADHAVTLLPT